MIELHQPINCEVVYGQPSFYELVEHAEIVISCGSTAGVEALMQNKKVIEIGKNPAYYNIDSPPITRADSIADISSAINKALISKIPTNDLLLFSALIESSKPINDSNKISINDSNFKYKAIAKELAISIGK